MSLILLFLFQSAPTPDNSWDGWWPSVQWTRGAEPPAKDAIRTARRQWERIDYPAIKTPWGTAGVGFQPARENNNPPNGIRLDILFSADAEEMRTGNFKQPGKEEVDAVILTTAGLEIARPREAPHMLGWAGNSLGGSGNYLIEFGWLPQSLEDYWIKLRMKDKTAWILLPYGLGDDPSNALKEVAGAGESPVRPTNATKDDAVLVWQRVRYDLGWVDEKGKVEPDLPVGLGNNQRQAWVQARIHVTASLSNPFNGSVEIELYRERSQPSSLTRPRTTVAIGVSGSRVFFGSLVGLRRDEAYRRYDDFKLWQQPADDRRWGLLRVTLEESALEAALPGSLFQYVHGRVKQD